MWKSPAFRYWYLPWAVCVVLLWCHQPSDATQAPEDYAPTGEAKPPPPAPPPPPCAIVRVPPRFPGGEDALDKWVTEYLQYPSHRRGQSTAGIAEVSFVVGPDGFVRDPKLIRDPGHDRGTDLLRAFRTMEAERIKWQPAWRNGDCLDLPQATSHRRTYRVYYAMVWVAYWR